MKREQMLKIAANDQDTAVIVLSAGRAYKTPVIQTSLALHLTLTTHTHTHTHTHAHTLDTNNVR